MAIWMNNRKTTWWIGSVNVHHTIKLHLEQECEWCEWSRNRIGHKFVLCYLHSSYSTMNSAAIQWKLFE